MRKLFALLFIAFALNIFGQDTIPSKAERDKRTIVEKVDAEKACYKLLRLSKSSIAKCMKGATNYSGDPESDIYLIYSSREKKNVPVRLSYMRYIDDSLRVYKVEFINRKSYMTNDLREAFWIELLKEY